MHTPRHSPAPQPAASRPFEVIGSQAICGNHARAPHRPRAREHSTPPVILARHQARTSIRQLAYPRPHRPLGSAFHSSTRPPRSQGPLCVKSFRLCCFECGPNARAHPHVSQEARSSCSAALQGGTVSCKDARVRSWINLRSSLAKPSGGKTREGNYSFRKNPIAAPSARAPVHRDSRLAASFSPAPRRSKKISSIRFCSCRVSSSRKASNCRRRKFSKIFICRSTS